MRKFGQQSVVATVIFLSLSAVASPSNESFLWHIRKTQWSADDETKYEKFVQALGETKCNTLSNCLKSPNNPYTGVRPELPKLSVDCSKLPYFVRAYFAWANDLPFSFVSSVTGLRQHGPDLRYSKSGNFVTSRTDIVSEPGKAANIVKVLNYISNYVDSSVFRIDAASETKDHYSDLYPVKLDAKTIKPGTVFYDVDGHLVLVYRVEKDGRILYMDSHPDNSLTRGTYGAKFQRSNPRMGGGFKHWRPLVLEQAQRDQNGNYVGGKMVPVANEQLADFSMEQYLGTNPDPSGDWKKGLFVYQGKTLPYQEYLRATLVGGDFKLNPVTEFTNSLKELCGYLTDRIASVYVGVAAHLDKQEHPNVLPPNIFGADGDWETYSTASRDLRVRTMYRDVVASAGQMISRFNAHDSTIDYHGSDLRGDLSNVYRTQSSACTVTYTNSAAQPVTLSLEDIRVRAFDISFDPYDCVERRWGATSAQEMATCHTTRDKDRWYLSEKNMRRLSVRLPNVSEASAQDLLTPADLDINAALK